MDRLKEMIFEELAIGDIFKIANKNYEVYRNAKLKKISDSEYMVMSGKNKNTVRSFWDWVEVNKCIE